MEYRISEIADHEARCSCKQCRAFEAEARAFIGYKGDRPELRVTDRLFESFKAVTGRTVKLEDTDKIKKGGPKVGDESGRRRPGSRSPIDEKLGRSLAALIRR